MTHKAKLQVYLIITRKIYQQPEIQKGRYFYIKQIKITELKLKYCFKLDKFKVLTLA